MNQRVFSAGFSFFEVIIFLAVIIFLGELILPHYINATKSARVVAINAVAGALNTSVYLVAKEYRSQHSPVNRAVILKGVPVKVSSGKGYPEGSEHGIGKVMPAIDGFTSTYGNVTQYDFSPPITDCHVIYNAVSGEVHVVTTGC